MPGHMNGCLQKRVSFKPLLDVQVVRKGKEKGKNDRNQTEERSQEMKNRLVLKGQIVAY